jgi:hypothetical protein
MKIAQPINSSLTQDSLLEKVVLAGDLSGLNPIEKVKYVSGVCSSLGLNPLTQPLKIMKFQGKEILYAGKDCTEQLRKNHRVSINKIETQMHQDSGVYIATSYASTADGRQDVSTGAVVISGLKGEALANAMMKAETKSKRRATLSICGLGILDESEMDTMPGAKEVDITPKPVEVKAVPKEIQPEVFQAIPEEVLFLCDAYMVDIEECQNLEDLKGVFTSILHGDVKKYPDLIKKLIDAKDKRKNAIEKHESNSRIDSETGEIL